jgi:biofilm PGA synthesis protein PgaD
MSNHLIIDKPHLQNHMQRYGWGTVTFIAWAIYVYLWMPMLTLFAWWIGYKLFHIHFIELNGAAGLFDKLALYATIILVLSAILIIWARIEQLRFKDKERRKAGSAVSLREVALRYKLNENQLGRIRQKKSIQVVFNASGNIDKILEY